MDGAWRSQWVEDPYFHGLSKANLHLTGRAKDAGCGWAPERGAPTGRGEHGNGSAPSAGGPALRSGRLGEGQEQHGHM
eukprot:11080706-Alexandrium_andersonii.AAC.1